MLSAKDRIKSFWQWFSEKHAEFEKILDAGNDDKAIELISEKFEKIGFPQQFLIGCIDKYELIFTPEGSCAIKLLSRAWRDAAPAELNEKWNFLTFKEGRDVDFKLMIDGKTYNTKKLVFAYEAANGKFNIDLFSKKFKRLSAEKRNDAAHIILENMFGEYLVGQRIGEINPIGKKSELKKKKCSSRKFRKIVKNCEKEFSWKPLSDPYDDWRLFKSTKDPKEGVNKDVYLFSTTEPDTVTSPKKVAEEAYSYGARLCGFAIECDSKDSNSFLAERDAFAEKLKKLLAEKDLGYVIGFKTGISHAYVDLFTTDDSALAVYLSDIKEFTHKNVELYFL